VLVRHPHVLGLHAIGSGPEGSFLVTQPAAASPLAEVVQQRGLVPQEAASLTARIARAVQAFHNQGACHGRLSPEWILARGDLEPVLCPCGFPSQSTEDRVRDVQALGRMLQGWLPPRRGAQGTLVLRPLYRVADAAAKGQYDRPADLAADLERAGRYIRIRWREGWAYILVMLLIAGGALVFPVLLRVWGTPQAFDRPDPIVRSLPQSVVEGYFLLALLPAIVLLSYLHGRALVRWAAERRNPGKGRSWGAGAVAGPPLLMSVLLLVLISIPGLTNLAAGNAGSRVAGSLPLLAGTFASLWFLGVCLALVVSFVELLFRSLQAAPSVREEEERPTADSIPAASGLRPSLPSTP
jgi:hypothetical protein